MKKLSTLTKRELLSEYNELLTMLDVCYGCRDLQYIDMLEREISRRGYDLTIKQNCTL